MTQIFVILLGVVLAYKVFSFLTFRLLPRFIIIAVFAFAAMKLLAELAPLVFEVLPRSVGG